MHDLEGTGADWLGIERERIDIRIFREQMSRDDLVGAVAVAEDGIYERRKLPLEMKDDRRRIRCLDARDDFVSVSRDNIICTIHDGVEREAHVGARERCTVLPLYATSQMIGDREPVAADVAVREGWNARCEHRDVGAVGLRRNERIEREAVEEHLGGVARE